MEVINEPLPGLKVIQPRVFEDPRGYFFESYSKSAFDALNIKTGEFVQDNQSLSNAGVLRGLHFQAPPFDQGKLVRVIKGAVFDVAVDIRKNSPTYGKHFGIELTEENKTVFWVPPGFAHGFQTLRDETIFSYKCTNVYNKESEGGIIWNDPKLGIAWKTDIEPLLSDKDLKNDHFEHFNSPFVYE